MTDELSYDILLKIYNIMQKMLQEATQENWQELNRLDGERRILLGYDTDSESSKLIIENHNNIRSNSNDKVINASPSKIDHCNNSMNYRLLSEKVTHLDCSIMKTVTVARKSVLDENRELSSQVKAKDCYARTSALTSVSS